MEFSLGCLFERRGLKEETEGEDGIRICIIDLCASVNKWTKRRIILERKRWIGCVVRRIQDDKKRISLHGFITCQLFFTIQVIPSLLLKPYFYTIQKNPNHNVFLTRIIITTVDCNLCIVLYYF